MIRLNSELSVRAQSIVSIRVDTYGRGVHVTVEGHKGAEWVDCDYGQSAYDTKARLEREVEEQLKCD